MDPKARVIIASGFAADGGTKNKEELRCRGFVSKPYSMGQMLEVVPRSWTRRNDESENG